MSAAVLEPHQCPGSVARAPGNRLQLYTWVVSRMPFVLRLLAQSFSRSRNSIIFLLQLGWTPVFYLAPTCTKPKMTQINLEEQAMGYLQWCESWSYKKIFPVLTPGSTLLPSSLSKDFLLQSSGPASPWAGFSFFLDFNFLVTKWRHSFCIPHILQKRLGQGGGP